MMTNSVPGQQSPFVGPRPFKRSESALFFGRDWETRQVSSLIAASDITVLFGVSGTGKTSLLNTAVVPLLEEDGYLVLPVCRPAAGAVTTAHHDLNPFVASVLDSWRVPTSVAATIPDALQSILKQFSKGNDEMHLVAAFDQFEELFSFPQFWAFRDQFISQVATAVSAVATLHCVFVLREDHLASIEAAVGSQFGALQARFRLERLRRESARMAIEEPLRVWGKKITESAIDLLLKDLLTIRAESPDGGIVEAVGEFVEPLAIQVVGERLWRDVPAIVSTIDSDSLIRIQKRARRAGRQTSIVDNALARFYEHAVNEVASLAQVPALVLREWCESNLITASGTRAFLHRGKDLTGGLSNRIPELFEARHLLASHWRAGAQWYELAHDRLISPLTDSNQIHRKAREAALSRARRVVEETELRMLATNANLAELEQRLQRAVQVCERLGAVDAAIDGLSALWTSQWRRKDEFGAYETLRRALSISRLGDTKRQLAILDILGDVALHLELYDDAVLHFTEMMDKTSRTLWARSLERRGEAYWYLGQLDQAAADYRGCLDIAPESEMHPLFASCFGQVLAERGETAEAIPFLTRAIDQSRGTDMTITAYASSGLGLALAKSGDWTKARAAFDESLRLAPENAWAYFNKGVALQLHGLNAEASEALEKSLALAGPRLPPSKRERAARMLEALRRPWSGIG